MRLCLAVLCILTAASAVVFAQAPARPAGPSERPPLLTAEMSWRKHYTFFPPELAVEQAGEAGVEPDLASRRKALSRFFVVGFDTPAPPEDWRQRAFDDADWLSRRGREHTMGDSRATQFGREETSVYLRATDPFVEEIGLVCMRGKFVVTDPAAVGKLTLSMGYRGGFVTYLNGQEVARANLPGGKLSPQTPAEVYPLEAWFVADQLKQGKKVELNWFNHARSDQWGLRERNAGPIELPARLLVKGVNVLALEMHRSSFPAGCFPEKVNWRTPHSLGFSPIGLAALELRASGGGAGPLTQPMLGLQVWNADVTQALPAASQPPPDAELGPIRIEAARNGRFSGQIVVRACEPLGSNRAVCTPLKGPGGAVISPSAISVRYGAVNPVHGGGGGEYVAAKTTDGKPDPGAPKTYRPQFGRLDLLLDVLPRDAMIVPIWATVHVPADAAPGDYGGTLTISFDRMNPPLPRGATQSPSRSTENSPRRKAGVEGTIRVPVSLHVADWTLPDMADRIELVNIYQSPDTLAAYYRAQPWSDAHWKLIERSLKLIGEAGNIGLFIPLLAEGQLGNSESMVVWVKGTNGSFTHDFSRFDRYMDLAMKYHDPARLRFVSLGAWGYQCRAGKDGKSYGAEVTVRGPDGAVGKMKLPECGTEEAETLLRPLLTGLRDRLEKRGLGGKVWLGLPADGSPPPAHVAMFRNILPGSPWIRESHFNIAAFGYDVKDKSAVVPVAYNSIVWGGDIPDPATKRLYGWQYNPRHLVMTFNRPGTECLVLNGFPPPWSFRMWMESTLACGRNGNGRVGADFFYMGLRPRGGSGRISSEASGGCSGTLFGSYLPSAVGQVGLGNSTTDLLGPGPDGPVTTVRFENAVEGNAEAEARIFIEKALLDKERPLPAELAARAQKLLDERTNVLRMWSIGAGDVAPYRWQDRARALYELAGEIAKARKSD